MASPKARDYAGEYARRVARATAAGKSRQAARGHAKGEGKAVRTRPTTKTQRQAAQARGAALKQYGAVLKRGKAGKDRDSGLTGTAFKSSLADRRNWRKPGDMVFTFRGVPMTISPKLEAQQGGDTSKKVYQSVPLRFTKLDRPSWYTGENWPPTIGDVLSDLDTWIDWAAGKTDLENPEFVDAYAIAKSLME